MSKFPSGPLFTAVLLPLLVLLNVPAVLWSAPVEVTFFPQSARVTEVEKVRLDAAAGGLKKLFLRYRAKPIWTPSYQVTDNTRATIEDQTCGKSPARIEPYQRAEEKNGRSEKRADQKTGRNQALESQVQLWQMQTKAKFKTLNDASNMSAAMGKNIRKALTEKLLLEPELEKLDKQIAQVQEELNAAGGKTDNAWEVTVLLSGVRENNVTLSFAYSLSGCGWTPLYRLEAHPLTNQIRFTWEGEVWQSSGRDWKQAAFTWPITTLLDLIPFPLPRGSSNPNRRPGL
jgi:hypothetical protein